MSTKERDPEKGRCYIAGEPHTEKVFTKSMGSLLPISSIEIGVERRSNRETLMEELKRLNENAQAEVDKLLAKIATPVEISAPAPHK